MGTLSFRSLATALVILIFFRVLWDGAMLSAYTVISQRGGLHQGSLFRETLKTFTKSLMIWHLQPPGCAQLLRGALHEWRVNASINPHVDFLNRLADVAAGCPAEEAALAAQDAPGVVIDIGAGAVTLAALHHNSRVVIAVEPDPRVSHVLRERAMQLPGARFFFGIRAAAGERAERLDMLFHISEPGTSCFTCFDAREKGVFPAKVRVDTVDKFLQEASVSENENVALLKIDVQGFELQVLRGVNASFSKGAVHVVLTKFDLRLLQTRKKAIDMLDTLLEHGFECVHMALTGEQSRQEEPLRFAELPLTTANTHLFYDFVHHLGGATDMLCLKRQVRHTQPVIRLEFAASKPRRKINSR